MSWDYLWKAGPKGGSLLDLDDYTVFTRLVTEFIAGKRGSDPIVQYRHGSFSSPRKWAKAANVILETGLRYTGPLGTVTHTDGEAGHVYENLATLGRIFGGEQGKLVTLQRTAPHMGPVEIDVELISDAVPTQQPWVFGWALRAPHPYWRDTVQRTGLTSPVTPTGNAPVDDFVIKIVGGTDVKVTHDGSGAFLQIEGATPGAGVLIDVGAGTCVQVTGGTDYRAALVASEPWWMEMDGGIANSFTVTGGGTVTFDLYDKWR